MVLPLLLQNGVYTTRAFRHVLPAPPTPRVRRCLVALTDGSTDIDVLSDFIRHLSDGDTTHPRGHIIVPEMRRVRFSGHVHVQTLRHAFAVVFL